MQTFLNKKKTLKVFSTVAGKVKKLSSINGRVFLKKRFNNGIVIEPIIANKLIYTSPIAGKVYDISNFKNAFKIRNKKGVEILVYIFSPEIKKMESKAFNFKVCIGQKVKKMQEILEVDQELLKSLSSDIYAIIVVSSGQKVITTIQKKVTNEEEIFRVV